MCPTYYIAETARWACWLRLKNVFVVNLYFFRKYKLAKVFFCFLITIRIPTELYYPEWKVEADERYEEEPNTGVEHLRKLVCPPEALIRRRTPACTATVSA